MKRIIFIIGGKSTGVEIREVVNLHYKDSFDEVYNVIGDDEEPCSYSYIYDKDLTSFLQQKEVVLYYILSASNHKLRKKFISEFSDKNISPISIIHPNTMISDSASVGKGTYIAYGSVLSSFSKVGDHCMLNFTTLVGHDAIVNDNTIVNPGCKISGNVVVGCDSLLGSNVFIRQGMTLGDNVYIDAMSYINKNIDSGKMCTSKIELKEYKNIFR